MCLLKRKCICEFEIADLKLFVKADFLKPKRQGMRDHQGEFHLPILSLNALDSLESVEEAAGQGVNSISASHIQVICCSKIERHSIQKHYFLA